MTMVGTATQTTAASTTDSAEMQRWLDAHQHLEGSDAYDRVATRLVAIFAAPPGSATVNGALR